LAGALVFLGLGTSDVAAQTRVIFEPSWFLSNANGTVNYGGAPVDVDLGIGNSSIKTSLDGRLEVDFGNWAAHIGAGFQRVDMMGSTTIEDAGPASARSRYDLFTLEAVGFYSLAGQPEGLEVYGGARVVSIDAKLDWTTPAPLESGEIEKNEGFVSPLIGLKVSSASDGKLFGNARADLGGFGIGANFMLNGVAKGGYRLTRGISVEGGVRYFSVDYEKGARNLPGGFRFDMRNFGFLIGLGIASG
jgi:hypothetical protein